MSTSHSPIEAKHDASHGSLTSYIIGFVLLARSHGVFVRGRHERGGPASMMLPTITVLAVVQLLVQLVFFLHLGTAPEQRSNTVIFVLTLLAHRDDRGRLAVGHAQRQRQHDADADDAGARAGEGLTGAYLWRNERRGRLIRPRPDTTAYAVSVKHLGG